ncbi:hypothetical protein EJ06DRAFT_78660 [Trichodelitschia bisporula]|uniref:Uncharacterized protein n=1 Tax=Trichodelitschia bisporula TaxID=703511 RepID=A0A6G1HTT1_9PEZI|nr:hypothetical protein EJ06DRAFT_78660 [Trichodelitschia bisporula]
MLRAPWASWPSTWLSPLLPCSPPASKTKHSIVPQSRLPNMVNEQRASRKEKKNPLHPPNFSPLKGPASPRCRFPTGPSHTPAYKPSPAHTRCSLTLSVRGRIERALPICVKKHLARGPYGGTVA